MTNVLLSIKPEFADKIFNGTKTWEFRRKIFKRNDVEKVIIYQTAPLSRIVGEFEIDRIINADPACMWNLIRSEKSCGMDAIRYFGYFQGVKKGYGIAIKNPKRYKTPKPLEDYGIYHAPQNFRYIGGGE